MGMLEQYAEAKKRLIAKLEDCENVHLEIKGQKGKPGLFETKGLRGEDYYRFNVEVGVGEFGMNEWNRLAEVSTGTRRYLASTAVAEEMKACAEKLVVVWRENLEREHMERGIPESVFEEDEEEDYVDSDEVTATKKRVERVKKGRRNSGGYATASPVAQGRERRSNKVLIDHKRHSAQSQLSPSIPLAIFANHT